MAHKYPCWQWLACFFGIAALGMTLDLVTKDYISGKLADEHRVDSVIVQKEIIPQWFSLLSNSPLNKGALFSLGNKFGIQANTFFITVSCLAILGILTWSLWPNIKRPAIYTVTLALILAGAIGNCTDRIVYGGVRDWIWVYYRRGEGDMPFNWPVFNIADCFLVGGAILLILHGLIWPAPVKEANNSITPVPAKA